MEIALLRFSHHKLLESFISTIHRHWFLYRFALTSLLDIVRKIERLAIRIVCVCLYKSRRLSKRMSAFIFPYEKMLDTIAQEARTLQNCDKFVCRSTVCSTHKGHFPEPLELWKVGRYLWREIGEREDPFVDTKLAVGRIFFSSLKLLDIS
jgi:hypothetical protein